MNATADTSFHAQGKKLSAFQVRLRGASFEMYGEHTVHPGIYTTGLSFARMVPSTLRTG